MFLCPSSLLKLYLLLAILFSPLIFKWLNKKNEEWMEERMGSIPFLFRFYSGFIPVLFQFYSSFIPVLFRIYSGFLYSGRKFGRKSETTSFPFPPKALKVALARSSVACKILASQCTSEVIIISAQFARNWLISYRSCDLWLVRTSGPYWFILCSVE